MKTIPATLAPFFQEYHFESLTLQNDSATIIERTLRYGTRAELKWLFTEISHTQIKEWVEKWGTYALPSPHLAFWKLLLEIE